MDMRLIVGRNVRRLRQERRLTQEAFAERSGFAQTYVSQLENGRLNPTIVTLFELAQALGVKPHILIMDEAPEASASS